MDRKRQEPAGSRTVKASEFKAHCLQLMDEVAQSGEEILITKRGRPVSRLVPCHQQPPALFGADRDTIHVHGDIVAPVGVQWEAGADPGQVENQ